MRRRGGSVQSAAQPTGEDRSSQGKFPVCSCLPGVVMTVKLAATLICAAAFAASAPALADGSKEAGQAKSVPCVACHSIDGNSVNPEWPSIAGQHESYLVRQLKAFRDGTRQNPLMSPMAAGLSDEDIADLAAWFSSQT